MTVLTDSIFPRGKAGEVGFAFRIVKLPTGVQFRAKGEAIEGGICFIPAATAVQFFGVYH
jgi:hypothetical protein